MIHIRTTIDVKGYQEGPQLIDIILGYLVVHHIINLAQYNDIRHKALNVGEIT